MAEDRFNPLNAQAHRWDPLYPVGMAEGQSNPNVTPRQAPGRQAEEPSPPDGTFDAFLDEVFGADETSEEPDTTAEVPESPEPDPEEPPATIPPPEKAVSSPPPPAQPAAVPPPPRFAYNGQYYTLEELATQGLLTEALQKATQFDSARQQPPVQPVQQAQQQPQTPPQRQVTPEEVQRTYAPMVERMVSDGWMEADVPTLYPQTTAAIMQMFTLAQQAHQMASALVQARMQEQQETQRTTASSRLDAAITSAAEQGTLYQGLKDPTIRQGFRDFLVNEVNPVVEQVTPEFVSRLWFAYNQDIIRDLAQQVQQPAVQGTQNGHTTAVAPPAPAARGSARMDRVPVEQDPWADLIQGIL